MYYIQLIEGVVKLSDVLTGFLSAESVHFRERGVRSPTTIVDSSIFPCSSISFCLTWFDTVVRYIHVIFS